jgi:hypothetical protein
VFNLFVIEGYAHKEIADMLGISEVSQATLVAEVQVRLVLPPEEVPALPIGGRAPLEAMMTIDLMASLRASGAHEAADLMETHRGKLQRVVKTKKTELLFMALFLQLLKPGRPSGRDRARWRSVRLVQRPQGTTPHPGGRPLPRRRGVATERRPP